MSRATFDITSVPEEQIQCVHFRGYLAEDAPIEEENTPTPGMSQRNKFTVNPWGGATVTYFCDEERGCILVQIAQCKPNERFVNSRGRNRALQKLYSRPYRIDKREFFLQAGLLIGEDTQKRIWFKDFTRFTIHRIIRYILYRTGLLEQTYLTRGEQQLFMEQKIDELFINNKTRHIHEDYRKLRKGYNKSKKKM